MPRFNSENAMKDMIENASALHNWKQRNAILKSRPMPNADDLRYQFLKLEFLLARSESNHGS